MPNRKTRDRYEAAPAEIIAKYLAESGNELLDCVITAAALVAGADGRIEPVERGNCWISCAATGFWRYSGAPTSSTLSNAELVGSKVKPASRARLTALCGSPAVRRHALSSTPAARSRLRTADLIKASAACWG
jgi:hypothetical protein